MATCNLTPDRLREFFTYDQSTGLFSRVKRVRSKSGKIGYNPTYINEKGYGIVSIDGRDYRLHRLAWFYCYGVWPKDQLDHINGNKIDNRIENLRDVSNAENHQNLRKANSNNATGLLGVSRKRSKWKAQIVVNGRNISLGVHETPELAHQAYLYEKRKSHPTCTI